MKIYFKNAKILSQGTIIEGDVLVENDRIAYIGKPISVDADRVIDVAGNLLMSGFTNAHCHTPSTVLRGISDDKPLEEWLDEIIPYETSMTEEDIYWSTMLGIAEYVSGGITSVEENYGNIKPIAQAYKKSGMRARVSIGLPNVNALEILPFEMQLSIVQDAGLSAVCYAHSVYGTSEENLDKLTTFSHKNNLPVSIHMSETLKEVGDCTVKFDKTPPELLEEIGFFDRDCIVYHCVHCDKDDIQILANYDVGVITCPSSNLKLGSGIAPIYALQNAGIKIGIGTDGAYSNNSYDMFKEMFLVATLNKGTLNRADIIPALDVVHMATKNGAELLGFENVGDIVVGNFADLILIDLSKPHNQPNNDIISNLVYATKSSDVYLTMINGKIVYENGKYFIGEEISEIYLKNQEIRVKIKELGGKNE